MGKRSTLLSIRFRPSQYSAQLREWRLQVYKTNRPKLPKSNLSAVERYPRYPPLIAGGLSDREDPSRDRDSGRMLSRSSSFVAFRSRETIDSNSEHKDLSANINPADYIDTPNDNLTDVNSEIPAENQVAPPFTHPRSTGGVTNVELAAAEPFFKFEQDDLGLATATDTVWAIYKPSDELRALWSETTFLEPDTRDEMRTMARWFSAACSHEDVFDLYYLCMCSLAETMPVEGSELLAAVLGCVRSATTPLQHKAAWRLVELLLQWYEVNEVGGCVGWCVLDLSRQYHHHLDWKQRCREAIKVLADAALNDALSLALYEPMSFMLQHDGCQHLVAELVNRVTEQQVANTDTVYHAESNTIIDTGPSVGVADEKFRSMVRTLLRWCVTVIASQRNDLAALRQVLPEDHRDTRQFMRQGIFCYLMEHWLRDLRDVSPWTSNEIKLKHQALTKVRSKLADTGTSRPEALYAMSMLFTGEEVCALEKASEASYDDAGIPGFLSANMSSLMAPNFAVEEAFANAYLPLTASPKIDYHQVLAPLCKSVLRLFARNVIENRCLATPSPELAAWSRLSPVAADFQRTTFNIRRATLNGMLFSVPASSDGGTINSMRGIAAKMKWSALLSTSSRRTPPSTAAMSVCSHSSWGFSATTGMPHNLSSLFDSMEIDRDKGTVANDLQDGAVMVSS
jgi:hypothetical protein